MSVDILALPRGATGELGMRIDIFHKASCLENAGKLKLTKFFTVMLFTCYFVDYTEKGLELL